MLALGFSLAIDRAGAQQQPSLGTNVNVISGTGKDGDWTLQRQNEPTIACSSRNPQNCMAGANDYRTVDIPFPDVGEKMTGDAWLGWYTTKNGGLTWRTRLLPGYPQDVSAAGMASPLKGYPAGADPIIRSGTNGMFYYGGLVFNREEGEGSTIFVARFIDNNNQEGVSGEPIAYIGTSVVHRIGNPPSLPNGRTRTTVRSRALPLVRRAKRRNEQRKKERKRNASGGGNVNARPSGTAGAMCEQARNRAASRWSTSPGWRSTFLAPARRCARSAAAIRESRFRAFLAVGSTWRMRSLMGRARNVAASCSPYSSDCARTWSPPRVISRVQSGDVNDDGVVNNTDLTRVQASYNRVCGQSGFSPNADVNNDCKVDLVDYTFVGRATGQPVPAQPRLSQGASIAIDPLTGAVQIAWRQFNDGVVPDAIVTVRSTNGGATMSAPRVVATLGSIRSVHHADLLPNQRLSDGRD